MVHTVVKMFILGRLTFFLVLPALTVFLVLTSLPSWTYILLLAVACFLYVLPSALVKAKPYGEVASHFLAFWTLVGVCYGLWLTAQPFQVDNPLVQYLVSVLNFDLLPKDFFRFLTAGCVGILLGTVYWYGNNIAKKGSVIARF